MKDLILITAHCPTPEKRKILHDLVIGLQPIRKDFDLMVVSHTPISSDVQEHVNWAIYDEDNELLTGWEYQNQPWFHPDNKLIQSVFFGKGNTYLPVHKQLITGYSLAKTFGYEKIQCIEYDAYYQDFTEFYDNSKALDKYDAILYTKENGYGEINIQFGLGHFHATKISSLDKRAFNYNREEMMEEILDSKSKTTEKRTQDIYTSNNNKVLFKDHSLLLTGGNKVRLVNFHALDLEIQWAVPYYNPYNDEIDFVAWNEDRDYFSKVIVIVNDDKIFDFSLPNKFHWSTKSLGKFNDINTITVIVNNKLKNHIELNDSNRKLFKQTNFIKYD
jgi:hypothetical protein